MTQCAAQCKCSCLGIYLTSPILNHRMVAFSSSSSRESEILRNAHKHAALIEDRDCFDSIFNRINRASPQALSSHFMLRAFDVSNNLEKAQRDASSKIQMTRYQNSHACSYRRRKAGIWGRLRLCN